MSTVEEIKAAIDKCTPSERQQLDNLLGGDDAWDKQMKADIRAGKLKGLIAKADAKYQIRNANVSNRIARER